MKSPSLDRLLPGILASALLAAAPAAQERSPAPSVGEPQRVAQEQIRTPDERPAPADRRSEKASGLPEVSDLAGVRGAFGQTDANKDGSLSLAEATRSGISRPMFQAFDIDSSGGIDRDEFTVSYRQLLADTRRPVHRDLDAEAARLRALNKQRHEEARKHRAQEGRREIVPAPEGPSNSTDAATARRANRQAEHDAAARRANRQAEHDATARRVGPQAERDSAARKANQEAEHAAAARRANRQAEHDAAARKARQERLHNAQGRKSDRPGTEHVRPASQRGKDARSNDAAHKAHQERIRSARRNQYGGQHRDSGTTQRANGQRAQDRPAPRGSQGHKPAPRRQEPRKQQAKSQRP